MPNTFTLIQAITVGSGGAANVEFTSIPSTYTDLTLNISARTSRTLTQDDFDISFNGSTSGLSYRRLLGTGSAASSDSGSRIITGYIAGDSSTASTFGNVSVYIPNYAGSANKSLSSDGVSETNATNVNMSMVANLWSNTAAITSIKLTPATSQTIQQHSTFYLYGVKNA